MLDLLLPDGLSSPGVLALLIATSYLGSAITAAFSIGGGLLLIAVMSSFMPAAAVVPVHGVVMLGSNGGRAFVYRRGIDFPTVGMFLIGAVIGATIGGTIVTDLPAAVLRLAIAGFILFTQWGPKLRLPLGGKSITVAGAISTCLTLFVGASGPFMTSILAKMPGYDRINLLGTTAMCMTFQHGLKVLVFFLAGFAYAPWLPFIGLSIAAGFLGTLTGAAILHRIDEQKFRTALKYILTGFAIYLTGLAVYGFTSA